MSQEVTEEEKPVISEEDEASGHDDKRTVSVEDDEKERMSLGEDKEGASSEEEDYRYQSEEEEIVISQSEFLNLQTFKHICFNIKETLDQIRSHRKVGIIKVESLNYDSCFPGDNFAWKEGNIFINFRRCNQWTLSYNFSGRYVNIWGETEIILIMFFLYQKIILPRFLRTMWREQEI